MKMLTSASSLYPLRFVVYDPDIPAASDRTQLQLRFASFNQNLIRNLSLCEQLVGNEFSFICNLHADALQESVPRNSILLPFAKAGREAVYFHLLSLSYLRPQHRDVRPVCRGSLDRFDITGNSIPINTCRGRTFKQSLKKPTPTRSASHNKDH